MKNKNYQFEQDLITNFKESTQVSSPADFLCGVILVAQDRFEKFFTKDEWSLYKACSSSKEMEIKLIKEYGQDTEIYKAYKLLTDFSIDLHKRIRKYYGDDVLEKLLENYASELGPLSKDQYSSLLNSRGVTDVTENLRKAQIKYTQR